MHAAETIHDFRGRPYDPKEFRPTGSNHRKVMHSTPAGLRVTLPADHVNSQPVGLVTTFGVQGDFEITMDFELLDVPNPVSGKGGPGVSLYIIMVSPTKEAATIGCWRGKDGDQGLTSHRATTPPDGKRQHSTEFAAISASSGKLRLVRSGKTLSFQFAPGDSEQFQQFRTSQLGDADLESVRIAADNGGASTKVDALIKSLTIRAGDLGTARPLPVRCARWAWWAGGGVVVLGVVVLFYWRWSRARSRG
jgi:hypothetical protein